MESPKVRSSFDFARSIAIVLTRIVSLSPPPPDGVPSYHERAMMLLINGARTSPYQFHMTFLAASSSSPPKYDLCHAASSRSYSLTRSLLVCRASIYALASTAYHQTLYWNFNLARGAAKEAEKHRAMIKGEYTGTDIGQYSSQVMLLNAPTPFEAVDRLLCQRMDNGLCTPYVRCPPYAPLVDACSQCLMQRCYCHGSSQDATRYEVQRTRLQRESPCCCSFWCSR